MVTRLRHLRDDQRGMSLVFVCVSFMSLMAATTIAIDVGMFMTARNQAQNSADAGALAGAVALVQNSYINRSSTGPAVQSAILTAKQNTVAGEAVDVDPGDVTFPVGPTGANNRVKVQVYRTQERENPITTLLGQFFGVNTVDITASATAEASPADAATCIKPFTIPDRWIEKHTAPWDSENDDFEMFNNKGVKLANPDVYIPLGEDDYTGYNAERDRGMVLRLKSDNSTKVAPSFYNPWAINGSSGAEDYATNIAECNTAVIPIGALMAAEPGNMTGPTVQGSTDLINKDPNARWDEGCDCVQGSKFAKSPRIAIIPVYDPVYYAEGKATGKNASLKIANYLGFFLERMDGNEVIGRITPAGGVLSGGAGPAPENAFLSVIRLVQ